MNDKYDFETNSIYFIVDENFINKFSSRAKSFMKEIYYAEYLLACERLSTKPSSFTNFFKNMRRRKIKIIQSACPYCGTIKMFTSDNSISDIKMMKHCTNCGKGTLYYNTMIQLNRIVRIQSFNEYGYGMLKKENDEDYNKFIRFDTNQLEIVSILSLLEYTLRGYFEMFIFLKYNHHLDEYFSKIIKQNYRNDFMNIDKANMHYKKALRIDLKKSISINDWKNLIDIDELRNAFAHNNGMLDSKFSNSSTYIRFKESIIGDFIFLDREVLYEFLKSVIYVINIIEKLYLDELNAKINRIIAMYYISENDV